MHLFGPLLTNQVVVTLFLVFWNKVLSVENIYVVRVRVKLVPVNCELGVVAQLFSRKIAPPYKVLVLSGEFLSGAYDRVFSNVGAG